jgi:hypothetical protein
MSSWIGAIWIKGGAMPVAKDVFFKTLGDEEIILDMKTGRYFGLNPVATFIWQGLLQNKTLHQIEIEMAGYFEVEIEEARRDLHDLARDLREHGLLVES